MPKRTAAIAAVAVLLFALTGCGEDADATPAGFADTAASAEKPAPLVADVTEAPADSVEAQYLEHLRRALEGSGGNSIPDATDEQLIAAGHEACEQMAAGATYGDVRVVDDEPETEVGFKDSNRIAATASIYFCTEFDVGG